MFRYLHGDKIYIPYMQLVKTYNIVTSNTRETTIK